MPTVGYADYEEISQRYGAYLQRALGVTYEGLAARGPAEDIVPGFSDLDFRVILSDQATPGDWIAADRACGEIHAELARENPAWWRILEHPPDFGLTMDELVDDVWFDPEMRTWHPWQGPEHVFTMLRAYHGGRLWDEVDEVHHLNTYLGSCVPYRREADPPINLGPDATEYRLHSRCWHYFAPPMTSVAALLRGTTPPGKRAALRWLTEDIERGDVVQQVLELVDRHYHAPDLVESDALAEFDADLHAAFGEVETVVRASLCHVDWPSDLGAADMKVRLAADRPSAAARQRLIETIRSVRFRVGRFAFYLDPPAGFDVGPLLRRECSAAERLLGLPIRIGTALLGLEDAERNPVVVIEAAMGRILSRDERESLQHTWALVESPPRDPAALRRTVERAVATWDRFYFVMETYAGRLLARLR